MNSIFKKMLAPIVGALLISGNAFAAEAQWLTDYDEGLALAKKDNRNMMVLFTGSDWCPWCKKLHSEILAKDDFTSFAEKNNLVLVELDFPRDNKPAQEVMQKRTALAKKYSIDGYPTIVLLTGAEKEFGRMGYERNGVSAFTQKYEDLAKSVAKTDNDEKLDYKITIDFADAPEMQGWLQAMQALCNEWYPILVAELPSEGYKPYRKVTIKVHSDPKGVAATGGANIFLSKEYFAKNGTDAGAVLHELVHVVQAYPKYIPWITEGIADYVRLYRFEPNAPRPRVNPEKANLRSGYKGTAAFLAWVVDNKDKEIIQKLNAALRQGTYKDELFEEYTGKKVDDLFQEFLDTLKKD